MAFRHPNTLVLAEASTSSNDSEDADYPDPKTFNLNDTHDQELFLHQYEVAQQHDPAVKYAVVVFYIILVSGLHACICSLMNGARACRVGKAITYAFGAACNPCKCSSKAIRYRPPHLPSTAHGSLPASQLTMVVAQSALFVWKQRHKRSYELVCACAFWSGPVIGDLHLRDVLFPSVGSLA